MFDGPYHDWNQKRIKGIIDKYGHNFFFKKSILDLGCGHADISGAFFRLGGDVTAVDARQEHLKVVSKKWVGIKTVRADLDGPWPFYGKMFDIIFDMGLMCHLADFHKHLKEVCNSTNYLVLETAVCDSDDPNQQIYLPDSKTVYDGSFNGISSFPSATAIEKVLTEMGFVFKRMDNSKFNSGNYVYDWPVTNSNAADIHKRRIWFANRNDGAHGGIELPPTNFGTVSPVQHIKDSLVPVGKTTARVSARPTPPGYNQEVVAPKTELVEVVKPEPQPEKKHIRTAVCISGHLRTFSTNYRSVYENLLRHFDCDVFIHTWDVLGMSYRPLDGNIHAINTHDLEGAINALYHPKKMIIEPSRKIESTPFIQSKVIDFRDVPGILSMYYKIEECNKLKSQFEQEQGFTYDCVIRFRGDLYLEQIFPIDFNMSKDHIHFPFYGNFGGLNDQLAWGSSKVMDDYSSLYSNIEACLRGGAPMHPERLLGYYINQFKKIPVNKVHYKYLIKRSNGLIQDNMLLERALGFIK